MESKQKDPFGAVLKGVATLRELSGINRFYVLLVLTGWEGAKNGLAADQQSDLPPARIFKCILPGGRRA
jgi:hypothetical protein